jgi:tetratricopeptide (TPR) repeat protein
MSAQLDPPAPDGGHEFLDHLRRRAFSCHERGELKAAESAYQRILESSPADSEVRRALGAVALQTGKFAWALQLLSQVAEFEDTADVQAQMGLALCGLSRLGDALRCYDRAIAAQFDHMPARINRAQVLHALGRREEAAYAYARTIELGFDNAVVHTLLGITLGDLGRSEESVACFERALSLEPAYLPAHVNLATQLRKLKSDAEARARRPQEPALEIVPVAAVALVAPVAPVAPITPITPIAPIAPVAPIAAVAGVAVELEARTDVDVPTTPPAVAYPSVRVTALHRFDWTVKLSGAAPKAAVLLLSVLLGSELARAAIALLARESPAVITTPGPAPARGAAFSFDTQSVVDAHLFGQVLQIQDPAMATPAKADLKLTGTLATADPRSGIAIIREQGKSNAYSVGDSLDGASLSQVYKDHVILERDGSFESLSLPRAH